MTCPSMKAIEETDALRGGCQGETGAEKGAVPLQVGELGRAARGLP